MRPRDADNLRIPHELGPERVVVAAELFVHPQVQHIVLVEPQVGF